LDAKDTEWACNTNTGFNTETQTWYTVLEDGTWLMCQVIWSYVGVFLVPAQSQLTFKLYNPHTKKTVWRSLNATGFSPDANDRRSCKANEFEIKHSGSPSGEESYTITGSLDKEKTVLVNLTFTRPADSPGFKYGDGPDGGFSVFGKDRAEGKRDGMVIHRFHPLVVSTGSVVVEGQIVDAKGDAMFVHAIQGMRPNNVAARWNFAFFTTGGGRELSKLGTVRAVQMEFETTDDYGAQGPKSGRIKTNIGAVYIPQLAQPLIVTGQTHPGGYPALSMSTSISRATHTSTAHDDFTGYVAPTGIKFEWEGESKAVDGGRVSAVLEKQLSIEDGQGGLIEKVNVLAEIPYLVRKALSAVTGIAPYIFQYHNAAELRVTLPNEEPVVVQGWLFNEATFISP